MLNLFRPRQTYLEDGERVAARILSCRPAAGRIGFDVEYEFDGGRRVALLPCNPLPKGGDLIKPGKTLRLTVVDDGRRIVEVEELVMRRAVAA